VCWGHDTGVIENNIVNFTDNWVGTGTIENTGDAERVVLDPGEYMESNIIHTGTVSVELYQNLYDISGDDVILSYRHASTQEGVASAGWTAYTIKFMSLGYVQVRIEVAA
jgi:hypothetical protein